MTPLKQLLAAAMLFLFLPVFAQKQTIHGKVTDNNGNPLPDVSVMVKATRTGTATDKDGSFTIDAAPTDVLIFSIIGFKTIANYFYIFIEFPFFIKRFYDIHIISRRRFQRNIVF